MSANIDLYLDSGGLGLQARGSAGGGQIPILTRNDSYNFRLRIQNAAIGQIPADIDLTGASLKLGIGNIDDGPTGGTFKLTYNSLTSLAISHNATTTQLLNAVSGIAGNVEVGNYGDENFSYLVTAATENTSLSFGADSSLLFPTSSVLISTRLSATTGVKEQKTIKLRRNPAVYANDFTIAPTSGIVSLSKSQSGSPTANETYRLSIGKDAEGGAFILSFGTNSTTGIPVNSNAASVGQALSAVTGIGQGNISVNDLIGEPGFSISFVRGLGQQSIVTALEIDTSSIYFAPWRQSIVTMATAELDELFSTSEGNSINPIIEIELVDNGNPKTLYQNEIVIRKDLISNLSVIPASQESYYTKTESDALFVTATSLSTNYYTRLEVDDLLDAITGSPATGDFYTKAQSDARYPTTAAISASYYTKIDSDSRYPTTASVSASYYTKADSDNRYPTTAAISASYYTKTETNTLFVEDSPSNVSASSRQLVNSATQIIIDWQSGHLGYAGALMVPTATTANGITISTVLNITTQTVVSGDLIVYGTLSAGPISAGDYYNRSESDTRFIRNSTTGFYAGSTTRTIFNYAGITAVHISVASPPDIFIYGDLEVREQLVVSQDATFRDWIYADQRIVVGENVVVSGNVDAGGNLLADGAALIGGLVDVGGTLDVEGNATLRLDADILGNLDVGGGATVSGNLLVKGSSTLSAGATINSNGLNVLGGGIDVVGGSVISGGLIIEDGDLNVASNAVIDGNLSVSGNTNVATLNSSGLITAITISATALSFNTLSFLTVSAFAITCSELKVVTAFGFGGGTPVTRYSSVTNVTTSSLISWEPFQVCSSGSPATMYLLSSGVTLPSFVGYDEKARESIRGILDAFGTATKGFGFLNVVNS